MNNVIPMHTPRPTMSSLELVDFINANRKEGEAELAHADFLKKVPKVLGEEVAGNFSGYYTAVKPVPAWTGSQTLGPSPAHQYPAAECVAASGHR